MIFGFFAQLFILSAAESTESAVTRDYCSLPDTVYADGVSAADFGATGWSYANAASWEGIIIIN